MHLLYSIPYAVISDVWVDRLSQLPLIIAALTASIITILKQLQTNKKIDNLTTNAAVKLEEIVCTVVKRVDVLESTMSKHLKSQDNQLTDLQKKVNNNE